MHLTSENKQQTRDKEEVLRTLSPPANRLQIPLKEVEWEWDKLVLTTASLLPGDSNFEPQIF